MLNPFYSAIFNIYAAKLVKEAFERVLKDDSFKLKTGFTSYVLSSATTILSQCENAVFLEFSNQLVSSLQKCIPRPNAKQSISKVQRQNMWSDYHHLISSQEFKDSWTAFLKKMGTNSHPSLYQFVTTKLMDSLIMQQLPIPGVSFNTPGLAPELTTVEENALRYVAGYVVKHTRDKIRSSRHTMQETLLHGLDQLCSTHHPHNYCEVESEQWINSVDRGGLVHVTHDTFMIFHSMEMELRQHFNKQRIADMQDESRTQLKESIVADVDVQFYMDRAADELEKEEKSELLRMIVDIYIVVRGFAFARSLLESHKQIQKKALQKSRGLRKSLHVSVKKD